MNRSTIKIIILLLLLIVVFVGLRSFGVDITVDNIREFIGSYGVLAPVVFIGIYIIAATVFFPGTPLTITSGVLFGAVQGSLYTIIGAALGASVAFFLSRMLGKDFVDRILKNKLHKLNKYDTRIRENGFLVMLFLRLVPLFPFNGLNYALGLTKMTFKQFFFGTLIGIIPGSFVLANIGASATDIRNPLFYLSITLFLLLASIPYVYKVVKKRKRSEKRLS